MSDWVLIAGDTHAVTSSAQILTQLVDRHEVKEIWQCGDLGWWPRESAYGPFIETLGEIPVPVYFADGNHEDHDNLDHDAEMPYEVASNVWHVPRGIVREVGGRRVMFFGGARSVDRTYRREGWSWFASELPSEEQWDRALAEKPVDVLVAHDSPSWVEYGYPPKHLAYWPYTDLLVSERFRQRLDLLQSAVKPKLWFCGHHHNRVTAAKFGTVVNTLNESTSPVSEWTILLNLKTMELRNV